MHVFVQHLDGKRVRELHWRDDAPAHGVGYVVGSDYFPVDDRGFVARLLGRTPRRRWQLPFDDDGADALQLGSRTPDGCERVVGTISTAGSGGALVQDSWSSDPAPWRVSKACDFIVEPESGPSIVVSLGLAPIVIAPPGVERASDVVEKLDPRHRRLLPGWLAAPSGTVQRVELRAGDVVEVVGVSRPIQQSSRRLERVGYRDAAQPALSVIGDEDGTRVVLRLCQRG